MYKHNRVVFTEQDLASCVRYDEYALVGNRFIKANAGLKKELKKAGFVSLYIKH